MQPLEKILPTSMLVIRQIRLGHITAITKVPSLPDVLERQGLFMNLLSKLFMSLILEKHVVVSEYFSASLKVLKQL